MLKEGLTALGKNSRQGPRFAACLPERDAVERFLQSLGPHVITWCGTGLSGWKGWEGKMSGEVGSTGLSQKKWENAFVFQVMASVDSEAGGILTSVTPKQSLCDGQWHSVAGMTSNSLLFTH